jgi:hypothetical protein
MSDDSHPDPICSPGKKKEGSDAVGNKEGHMRSRESRASSRLVDAPLVMVPLVT